MGNSFQMSEASGAAQEATVDPGITNTDILSASRNPLRITTDEGTVVERSIDEMIRADQYNRLENDSQVPPYGLKIAITRPGGAV